MYIVLVHALIKNDQIEAFTSATKDNAARSLGTEPGVIRFDVMQQTDDPAKFALLEVYRTPQDAVKHKETNHYSHWREVVEPMMVEPRSRVIYNNIIPSDLAYPKSMGD